MPISRAGPRFRPANINGLPHEVLYIGPVGGVELLMLAGEIIMGSQPYERGGWIRLPAGEPPVIAAGTQGATVYLKTGHLTGTAVHP